MSGVASARIFPVPHDKDVVPGFFTACGRSSTPSSSTFSKERLCPWRLLPREFPPWKSVYEWWFRRWRIDGTWERLNAELRELLRARLGRDPLP
jgi:hypothetical protein